MSADAAPNDAVQELLAKAYKVGDDGVEVFSLSALVPSRQRLEIRGVEYAVPGEVPLENFLMFLRFEQEQDEERMKTQEALAKGEKVEGADARGIHMLQQAERVIVELLKVENENVPETLGLGVNGVTYLITHLMGGQSATEAALATLSGGTIREVETALGDLYEMAAELGIDLPGAKNKKESEPLVPLASERRSSRRSSRSPKSTAGKRSGGGKSRSGRSASTSRRAAATS